MLPMLNKNISRVNLPINKVISNNLSSNSFSNMMKGKYNMSLMNLSMRSYRTIYYRPIIFKYKVLDLDMNT